MKKFLALLLMALLLIPALAMAETAVSMKIAPPAKPPVKLDVSTLKDMNKAYYQIKMQENPKKHNHHMLSSIMLTADNYSAEYFMSGALDTYTIKFGCGCQIKFSADGTMLEDAIMHVYEDATGISTNYFWNPEDKQWRKGHPFGEPQASLPDADTHPDCNAFKPEEHNGNVDITIAKAGRPPLTAVEASNKGGYDFKSFDELKASAANFPDNSTVIFSSGANDICKLKMNPDGLYGFFYDGKLIEWYAGALSCNMTNYPNIDPTDFWYRGDASIDSTTEGSYDWNSKNGDLVVYKFWNSDRSLTSGYSKNNVLRSCEVWDSEGAKWEFFEDVWTRNDTPENPNEEVLLKLLHAPEPAKYDSQCVTDVSQLTAENKGVPFIISDDPAMASITPNIEAKQSEDENKPR